MKHVLLSLLFFAFFALAARAQQTAKGGGDLSVFPNPTTEYISIQDNNEAISQVAVFNLVGKKMRVFTQAKGERFYVADLPKGMYMVQLIDHSQKVVSTQKLNKR